MPTTSNCDDVLNDCDIANKTLGVCSNFEAARKSCAEFCGLCGIGNVLLCKNVTNILCFIYLADIDN